MVTDAELEQTEAVLAKLGGEVSNLTEALTGQLQHISAGVNGIIGHTLAVEAILAVLLQQYPVAGEKVKEWIRATAGGRLPEAEMAQCLTVVDHLIGGKPMPTF